MAAKVHRKLTIPDILVLVVAIAIGLAWTRYFQGFDAGGEGFPFEEDSPAYLHSAWLVEWWIVSLWHCVAVVTIAVLVLRLVGPRPRFRQLTRQPGTVACGAVFFAVLVEMVYQMSEAAYALYGSSNVRILHAAYWIISGPFEAVSVGAAWLLLAISGRWRSDASWIDRFGFVLGVFWIATPLLAFFVHWLVRMLS
jgi:hypothetical protein